MRRSKCIWSLFILLAVFAAWGFKQSANDNGVTNTIAIFREGAEDFSAASLELEQAIHAISTEHPESITAAKKALKKSRLQYKQIEFFLDYFFFSSSMVYNRPAKTEIDEPYMEYQAPSGLQQIAVLLFDKDPVSHKKILETEAHVISTAAADLPSLLYQFSTSDKAIMESIRIELVRLYAGGITGYDAPELKSGIAETAQSVRTLQAVLAPWLASLSPETKKVSLYLQQCIHYLDAHPDFDTFDRLQFLTAYGLPLQEAVNTLITSLQLELHTRSALNYKAKNLFSKDALDPAAFANGQVYTEAEKILGQKLFFEKALSGNNGRNCATCHRPELYFTDGLRTSTAIDGTTSVRRNAPALSYAAFQYAQFWDGRAGTLSKQILTVISNPQEMNGNHAVIVARLKDSLFYRDAFREAFPRDTGITMPQIATAIAAYLSTLAPMNSAMDDYFAGNKQAMTPAQIRGFNLFTGKAQCATCHFAPLFNGLTPPLYQFTEFENLGMPANDDLLHPQADKDSGRYEFFPIEFYQRAFKTPTVRNSAMTAPYMHNGAFRDLEKVMAFYNAGGGNGIGMNDPYQTLSPTPLHLSDTEISDLVAFMHALTDKPAAP
ncbi:cytochrome-c peroxidase [Chitinophaga arvensicola]|uniref:Cytochrome c peroxidase n=1 Tax=Chitinophaga arvensicola TaxID=29529 RepID=A0A1I0SB86_9BACT|nr:cytochrome c peroxidase [Chitinophaga arvensicola]SEW53953.1 cytochrome c peroxidase [Chitinophaga arvensicola]